MRHLAIAAAAAAIVTGCVQAASPQTQTFDGLVGHIEADTNGDVEMNGAAVTLSGRVGGNAVLNGGSVDVDATIAGSLEANGGSVEIDGSVAGASLVSAGWADLRGAHAGPVAVNAGSANLSGAFASGFTANIGAIDFEGDAQAPVVISGQGRQGGWFRSGDGDRSRVLIDGMLAQGGSICAHEVTFGPGARLGAPIDIRADSRPDLPSGLDAALVSFTPRDNERCDQG